MSSTAPSTGQSYLDTAVGAVQSAIGSLTGRIEHEQAGAAKKAQGQNEYAASQTDAVKGPRFTVSSSSGAVAADDPDRAAGRWQQTVGSAKEAAGGLVGASGLQAEGREQRAKGQQQEVHGQASDLVSGAADRVKGAVGGALASATGNTQAAAAFQKQHDTGKARQRGVEEEVRE